MDFINTSFYNFITTHCSNITNCFPSKYRVRQVDKVNKMNAEIKSAVNVCHRVCEIAFNYILDVDLSHLEQTFSDPQFPQSWYLV